jgi:dihydroorotase-like cyclic amidohydrolase
VGADADLALVEIGGPWRIDTTAWLTRAREAARVWHGREVRGRVIGTYLRGQRVWDRTAGVTAPPGSGRQVRPTA